MLAVVPGDGAGHESGKGGSPSLIDGIVCEGAPRTPKITEVLPLLYLHGLSSGGFVPALGQFLGSSAGLPGPVITRLAGTWRAERRAFTERDLPGVDYVLWADGIHVNIGLEEHTLCLL